MLELGIGADLVRGIGWIFQLAFLTALGFALFKPKGWKAKAGWAILVLALFIGPVVPQAYDTYLFKQRYAKAKALLDERCKTAGEKIYRTAENVEEVLLMKVRPERTSASRGDALWADAALPDEYGGKWYVISFLGWEQRQGGEPGSVNVVPTPFPGYKYAETIDDDGRFSRYELARDANGWGKLSVVENIKTRARYSIDYVNDLDPRLREHWIAGTRIVVSDTQTKAVLAERLSYAFEPGLGSTAGFRSPWGFAQGCPRTVSGAQTRNFVERVLKLNQGK